MQPMVVYWKPITIQALQNPLDRICPEPFAIMLPIMNAIDATRRLREVIRRQHRAVSTASTQIRRKTQMVYGLSDRTAGRQEGGAEVFVVPLARKKKLLSSQTSQHMRDLGSRRALAAMGTRIAPAS